MVTYASNVFKKKPTIYASGQGSQYANNTAKQPAYDFTTGGQTSSATPRPQTTSTATGSTYRLPSPTAPVVSKTPNPWSMTDMLKPKTTTTQPIGPTFDPTKKPAAPTVTTPAVPTAQDKYITNVTSFADQQKLAQQERLKKNQDYIRNQYALSNQGLEASIPEYETAFNVFRDNSKAGVEDIRKSAEIQKQNTRDYYGEAQKLDAQTRNETRGQTGRTFAALGTTESRGEGSYQQGMENIDSEFNSVTAKRLNEQAGKLTDIDMAVGKAERESIALIQTEEAKKNTLIRQIKLAQQQNKLDEVQSLTEAYNNSEDNIAKIQESLDGLKYTAELEKEKISAETEKLKKEFEGLSPEFIQSGTPTTMNDFIYRSQHSDQYSKIGADTNKPKSASSLQVEGKAGAGLRALQTIESEILNNPMILSQASLPGTPGARQYEAAVSSLTDAIGGLRTGASVSPEQQKYYRNILPKLGDSAETIKYKLNAVKQELDGYTQGAAEIGSDLPPELLSLLGL